MTARPRRGWLAVTVTVPGEPGSERIQTAAAPPAAAKSNGIVADEHGGARDIQGDLPCHVRAGRAEAVHGAEREPGRVDAVAVDLGVVGR